MNPIHDLLSFGITGLLVLLNRRHIMEDDRIEHGLPNHHVLVQGHHGIHFIKSEITLLLLLAMATGAVVLHDRRDIGKIGREQLITLRR